MTIPFKMLMTLVLTLSWSLAAHSASLNLSKSKWTQISYEQLLEQAAENKLTGLLITFNQQKDKFSKPQRFNARILSTPLWNPRDLGGRGLLTMPLLLASQVDDMPAGTRLNFEHTPNMQNNGLYVLTEIKLKLPGN